MKAAALIVLCSSVLIAMPAAAQGKAAGPAGAAPATAAAMPLRPGLWETTLVVETEGTTDKRTVVGRVCHSAADAADLQRVVPKQREFGMKCENREVKAQGAGATWRIACSSPERTLAGSGEVTFAATTYSGHAQLESKKRGAKAGKLSETFSGKWLEACK